MVNDYLSVVTDRVSHVYRHLFKYDYFLIVNTRTTKWVILTHLLLLVVAIPELLKIGRIVFMKFIHFMREIHRYGFIL